MGGPPVPTFGSGRAKTGSLTGLSVFVFVRGSDREQPPAGEIGAALPLKMQIEYHFFDTVSIIGRGLRRFFFAPRARPI
jgi:hypothetical protein